ncbi:hypothetical protein ABFV83_19745 [Lacrimispora sp. BS-2]|uniref:Uncharacterized protein n=1 Tax=Lacrimispora sp. BS-2 TaxID=3151850 RepID=A0AAU7PP36_9FIRM
MIIQKSPPCGWAASDGTGCCMRSNTLRVYLYAQNAWAGKMKEGTVDEN